MNLYSLAPLITSILLLSLGIVAFSRNKESNLNRIFFILCLSSNVWLFSASLAYLTDIKNDAFYLMKFSYCGVVFIAISVFHFTIELIQLKKLKKIAAANYLVGAMWIGMIWMSGYVISDVYKYFWGYYPIAGRLHPLFLAFFIGLIAVSLSTLIYYLLFKKGRLEGLKRVQVKYFLLAIFIFNIASVDFLPNYKILIYPFGYIPAFIFILIVGYTVVRYRLMDIHLVLKKSMVYSLSAGILTSFFVVLVLTMTKFVSNVAGISSFTITTIAAITIAVLFNPLKNKVQSIIDKQFYKKTYDYYPTIRKISRELTSIFDIDELFKYVGEEIYSTLGLKNIYLLYTVPGRGYVRVFYRVYEKEHRGNEEEKSAENANVLKNDSEVVKFFENNEEILIKDELPKFERTLGQEIIGRMKADLVPFSGEAVVPVFKDKKLILLLILGEKLSGDMFTGEDINLLNIVANQVAIAISNADLYKNKVHTERLASIGMMSATFAHEIRNPLTSLKTFAQLMPEKYKDKEFRETFSKIVVGEIERIDGLIGDLLDFSSDKKASPVNFIDLTSLIDDIVEYVRGKIDFEKKGIIFRKNYSKDEIHMSGDAEKLKQAFINIISNGCQAMDGGGILKVDIQPNSEHVDVSVSDTGTGIHPDDISKIFDPFVTTKEMGIGLGLAISKRIIEDHKGQIDVESSLAKGTTFTVTLPVQNE